MDIYLVWLASGVALTIGVAAGAAAYAWWMQRIKLEKRRVPRQSAIVRRALVNTREKAVWRWLVESFRDHHVMVKIPVTRFTTPVSEVDRAQWFELLSDIYCTFTVATSEGNVIGCVDVPGPNGISPSNLLIKRKLFIRCGVPYRVVQAEKLPASGDIFSAFVREEDEMQIQIDAMEAAVTAGDLDRARAELRATVLRQRNSKSDTAVTRSGDAGFVDSVLAADWAPDSFNAPLDSRQADLS